MKFPTSKRIQEIVDLLQKEGYVRAKDLSEKYHVSMETIRKDLMFLEEKGVAQKEYGKKEFSDNNTLTLKSNTVQHTSLRLENLNL